MCWLITKAMKPKPGNTMALIKAGGGDGELLQFDCGSKRRDSAKTGRLDRGQ